MHRARPEPEPRDDGIQVLVAAERVWRTRLEATRADAARQIADARDAAERAVAAVQAELGPSVERRRAELEQALAREVADIDAVARAQAARFRDLSDETVEQLAIEIARRVPWLASAPSRPEPAR